MLKTLVKKQLLELFHIYVVDRKTGRARSHAATVRLIVLAVILFGALGFLFFVLSLGLGTVVLGNGVDWFYFAIMGLCALAFGVFGSVFNTYGSLYLPKDNELMLSLPIPTHTLLLARLSGVFATSLLYSAWLWIPGVIAYWVLAATEGVSVTVSLANVESCLLLTIILGLVVTVLSCLVGRIVAFVASKAKGRGLMSALCGVLVLGLYCLGYTGLINMVEYAAGHLSETSGAVQSWLHCLYTFGLAAQGDLGALVLVLAVTMLLVATCFIVLERSFNRIVIAEGSSIAATNKEKPHKAASMRIALMKRELAHFTSTPSWMLNCGFGLVLLPVAGVASLIMQGALQSALADLALEIAGLDALLPVMLFAALATTVSVNAISCASVSLEGKSIWITQSLPIDPWETLRAKADVAALLNSAAVLIATVCIGAACQLSALAIVLVGVASVLYTWCHAYLGLMLDLRHANLNWTDETVPVKHSISTLLSLLLGWAFCCLVVLAGCSLSGVFGFVPVLIGLMLVVLALAYALRHWLQSQGVAMLTTL